MKIKLKWRNRFRAIFLGEVNVQVKRRINPIILDNSKLSPGWHRLFGIHFEKLKRVKF